MALQRKLASIQIVKDVKSIPEAEFIEVIQVLGWKVVCKKNEFKIGDKVVYVEIDSILPEKPEFEFLRTNNFIIRTQKFRGQISQGICFPLSILPEGNYNEGDDVSDLIGVRKYEPPIPVGMDGIFIGKYPSWLPKSDETRVQILQDVLDKYKGAKCYYTEKIDGTSSSFSLYDEDFGVYGRRYRLQPNIKNGYWKVAMKYNLEEILRKENRNLAIQGEITGKYIQSNKYKRNNDDLFFNMFNIWDIDNQQYFSYQEFIDFANNYNIPTVPILCDDYILDNDIEKLIELSKGRSVINPNVRREGIVIRPLIEINDRFFGRVSFKAINPDFLIKYKE